MSAPVPPPRRMSGELITAPGRASKPLPCLAPIGNGQLCVLKPKHHGTHLPAAKWARTDISDSNPSVRSSK